MRKKIIREHLDIGDIRGDIDKAVKEITKEVEDIVDKSLKGITGVVDDIMKEMKRVISYVEDLDYLVDKTIDGVMFLEDWYNATAIILTLIVPIYGQIIARFMLLNGSIHHAWLMAFSIPPFTILPALAIMFDFIEPIEGDKPYDAMMILPIIANAVGYFLGAESKTRVVFKYLLTIGAFYYVYQDKANSYCGKGKMKHNRILMDSIISYVGSEILAVVIPHLPVINIPFQWITTAVPHAPLVLQTLCIASAYTFTNMLNGSYSRELCGFSISDDDINILTFFGLITALILIFAPTNIKGLGGKNMINMLKNNKTALPSLLTK